MRVLGIETSCDETGVALYDSERGILAQQLHSQAALHGEYGGVVPELASRDHVRRTLPLLMRVLEEAGSERDSVDAIAYTAGPGLVGALLVGACLGRALAWAWDVPAVGVHHMEAHLLAVMLEEPAPEFPFLALLVSGGHTLLVQADAPGAYRVLGQSLDDAAGEAFDKTARLLQLGYPGGPQLAQLAATGDAERFALPRPMLHSASLDFSFSGLKTGVARLVARQSEQGEWTEQLRADIAASFQEAVAETLSRKCCRALEQTGIGTLVVAGGVGANARLRQRLAEELPRCGGRVFYPRPEFCTDNGAMIACAGFYYLRDGRVTEDGGAVYPRWPLPETPTPMSL